MKKYFLFACVAAALVSCSSDDFLGNEASLTQGNDGAILFQSTNMKASRASNKVGAEAAAVLGNNFIVEGVKGADDAEVKDMDVVFDNYLVAWEQNSAGTSEDNTNDWKYVGVTGTTNCPTSVLSTLHQDVSAQTIKYWDYSQDAYNFIAYSTGTLKMTDGTPAAGTSVGVTAIAYDESDTKAYEFTAKSADDFAQCYYTDVTPVLKAAYGKPVTLTFKNLSAKVRVALYETVPGYAVKDVKFYQEDATDIPNDLASATKTAYATLIGKASFPEEGKITVCYPATAAVKGTLGDNWNKADVLVDATKNEPDTDPTYKEWGTLAYVAGEGELSGSNDYLGMTLDAASFAGVAADDYYKFVIPTNGENDALTLRVDYTLESIDGSGEVINVYGAKAVVPAIYTNWKSNYAYTYVFKISDNTNGWTANNPNTDTDVVQGLFPITFDAVVEAVNEGVANEQTTVTTVATPTVTSYQYGHKMNDNYGTSEDIFVQVMDNSVVPATLKADLTTTNSKLYAVAAGTTEADVISALNVQDPDNTDADKITGRNTTVLTITGTPTLSIANADTEIAFKDGTTTKPGNKAAAFFTPTAAGTYAFVYEAAATANTDEIYTYVAAVSKQASAPTNWATEYSKYYTKEADNVTYTAATATYDENAYYYRKYVVNDAQYAVKVIVVE